METEVVLENIVSVWDWLLVAVYTLGIIGIAAYFSRRQTSVEHYFVVDGKIPGWASGVSMFATLLSSFTFIAFPGWAYDNDWQIMCREFTAPLVLLVSVVFIIPVYRYAIGMSAYEYLEHRFGYFGRVYGNIGFLIGHIFKGAVVLFTMCFVLHNVTGVKIDILIVVLGVAVMLFTVVGGMEGVIWTDVVQGFLMLLAGLITIFFLIVVVTPDSVGSAFTHAWEADKFRLIDLEFTTTSETTWVFAWFGIFHFMTKYMTDQTMVQRYIVAPSVKEAVKGSFVSIACCMAAWIIFMTIGSLLWGYYNLHPERLSAAIVKGDAVYPYFIGKELPIGITGLILAGLFSATGSTMGSDLNCIGACVTSDFYDRFKHNPTTKGRLLVGKITVWISGVVFISLAWLLARYPGGIVKMTMHVSAYLGAIFAGAMLGMYMLGFFTRRTNRHGIYVAVGACAVFTIVALINTNGTVVEFGSSIRFHKWYLPGLSSILALITGYFSSFFIGKKEPAPKNLTVYGYEAPWTLLARSRSEKKDDD